MTEQTWKARPTTYRGIEMRSRLEARIAARFDLLNLDWTYEPRAFADQKGQYLPDFLLRDYPRPGDQTYVEVKPGSMSPYDVTLLYEDRLLRIASSEPQAYLAVLCGDWAPPAAPFFDMYLRLPDSGTLVAAPRWHAERDPVSAPTLRGRLLHGDRRTTSLSPQRVGTDT